MSSKISVEQASDEPLYVRVAAAIRAHIDQQALPPGAPLPSEFRLCELTGVSRVTLRHAVDELVKAHVVVRQRGIGSFVAKPQITQLLADLQSTRELFGDSVAGISSSIVEHRAGRATAHEAQVLRLRAKASIMRFTRVDAHSGKPFGVVEFVIPKSYAKHFTVEALSASSSYRLFSKLEVFPDRAVQRVRAEAAQPGTAEILGLAAGDPVLTLERTTFDRSGVPIEWGVATYRADTMEFEISLRKDQRTVREFERAGGAGIALEGQAVAKRCPAMVTPQTMSMEEGAARSGLQTPHLASPRNQRLSGSLLESTLVPLIRLQ